MLALPKVVTAQFISDPLKTTVCVYGHVDVQPGKLEDGWATDPYNLTEINGRASLVHPPLGQRSRNPLHRGQQQQMWFNFKL